METDCLRFSLKHIHIKAASVYRPLKCCHFMLSVIMSSSFLLCMDKELTGIKGFIRLILQNIYCKYYGASLIGNMHFQLFDSESITKEKMVLDVFTAMLLCFIFL